MRYLVFALALVVPLSAQAPTPGTVSAPTLSAEEAIRIQNIELKAEVLNLRIQTLQSELAKLQDNANTYLSSLKKDGYTLERGQDGTWRYTKNPSPQK